MEEERFNEAANEFKTLTQIANNEPLGHANLGLAYMRMDDELNNAKSALNNALELSPKNPDIKFLLAKIYEIEGLEKKSLSILEKVVAENPEHIKSLYQLGITLSKSSDSNDRELAITYLKRASNILPGNIPSSLKLMELLISADRSDDALYQLQTLQQTLPLIPKDANELLRKILELLHEGNSSEAKVPLIMLHNLLKPEDLYQASIIEVRGTKGPIAGNPITHFMNTQASTKYQKSKKIRNITFKDVTSSSNLSIANVGFDMKNIDDKYYPIFALGDYDLDGDIDLFNINRTTSQDNKKGEFLLENEGGYFTDRSSYTDFKHDGKDQSVIFSDFDNLPLRKNSFDLIICNFCTNKVLDKKSYLQKLLDTLTDDGLFICNFFGEQTLTELKQCFFIADDKFLNGAFNRIPKIYSMADFSNLLTGIGYNEIVTEKINFDVFYKNIIKILKDIKSMGEKIPIKDQKEKISKTYLKYLNEIYKKKFTDQNSQLKVTLDIISISCWKQLKKNSKNQ